MLDKEVELPWEGAAPQLPDKLWTASLNWSTGIPSCCTYIYLLVCSTPFAH